MLVKSRNLNKKYIRGAGFVDTMMSTLRNVGSYVAENKDLIAKPMLGALGNVGALALTEGAKAVINKLQNASTSRNNKGLKLSREAQDILEKLMNPPVLINKSSHPNTNVIGSGIKNFNFFVANN